MTDDELRTPMRETAKEQAWIEWRERYATKGKDIPNFAFVSADEFRRQVEEQLAVQAIIAEDVQPDHIVEGQ